MIGIYCPEVPPVPGGVSDHTLALAKALHEIGAKPVVFADRGDPKLFAPIPCITGLGPLDVADAARQAGVSTVIIQYVPFLFARRGVSPGIVLGARRMRRMGIRMAVVVHEPFVPFTRLPWLVTGVPQRMQFFYLCHQASWIYAPVPRYAALARNYGGPTPSVSLAPIGATIPVSTLSRADARAKLGLQGDQVAIGIFSPAASGFLHEWIATAVARLSAHPRVVWVRFGFGSNRVLPGYPEGPNVITVGDAAPETVANTMRALDIAASPYADGLTMRRSGAMLALATGVATVSSTGHQFDSALLSLAACEMTREAFADRIAELVDHPEARARWTQRTSGYADTASLESLARRMARDIEGIS